MSLRERLRFFIAAEKKLISMLGSSFIVRGLGVAAGFVMHVLLSRALGAEGAGVFYLALTLMMAAGVIGKFGLDTALMKYAGTAAGRDDMASVRGIYFQSSLLSVGLSVPATILLVFSAPWLAQELFNNSESEGAIIILALAVTPFSLIWIQSGVLKAIERPVAATLVESALLPSIMAASLVMILLFDSVSISTAGSAYLLATIATSLIGLVIFKSGPGARGHRKTISTMALTRDCAPLALIDMMNFLIAWAIFPILGSVAPASEVGIFNAGHKLAIQFSVILVVFGGIMAPKFAVLHEKNDLTELERQIKNATFFMSLAAMPVAILLLAWPEIVGVIFGSEFASADIILRVLVIGQLINLMTGPCGYVLAMTGHQTVLRNILLITLLITLPAIWYLGREHGAVGAAVASSFGLALQNLLALGFVYKYLGIFALPLYRSRQS